MSILQVGWRRFQVTGSEISGSPSFTLGEDSEGLEVAGALLVRLRDLPSFVELATSGYLRGRMESVEVRIATVHQSALPGVRLPSVPRDLGSFSWERVGSGVTITWTQRKPESLGFVLDRILRSVVRVRRWGCAGGPSYAIDPTTWRDGNSTWPVGTVVDTPPSREPDAEGRPLGPIVPTPTAGPRDLPIVTAVANPVGRALVGTAARYRLVVTDDGLCLRDPSDGREARFDGSRTPEHVAATSSLAKFAVATPVGRLEDDLLTRHTLRSLAAGGVVFASDDDQTRRQIEDLGLVAVTDDEEVADLAGYHLSATASRRALITSDGALRRSPLGGEGVVALPTVSAVLSSVRPTDIEACLAYLSAQSYPALEVVVGTHGYEVDPGTRARWADLVPFPLQIVSAPRATPLGSVLTLLTRAAGGEILTKVDDDDHYGPDHVTDLVLAHVTTGADLTSKGARFVHLPDAGKTLDRGWTIPEQFNVRPAGGTLMMSTSTLLEAGGWSTSSRHVDTDLIERVRSSGGITYRTHSLDYVYVRRSSGHTWSTEAATLAEQSRHTYDGLPDGILSRWPSSPRTPARA